MEIKEMPIEEKYDRLLDDYVQSAAVTQAFLEKIGAVDKRLDLYVEVQKKTLPSAIGIAYKVLKAISPGRAFGQVVDRFRYWGQTFFPLPTMQFGQVSDRETVGGITNCVMLKKAREQVKKAGLDIDPKFICKYDQKWLPAFFKEFGIGMTWELEENGCKFTAKLT